MDYRLLGKTGIKASVIGMGCEGFEGKSTDECVELLDYAFAQGINIIDVYTSNPTLRSNLGIALKTYDRANFIIQGHLCSAWDDGQYRRTRKIDEVKQAFNDLLTQMQLEYIDIGMIHYCDDAADFEKIMHGEILQYAKELLEQGIIHCIGLSTHNTDVAHLAAKSGEIDVIMFSSNPAYDMLPATDDVESFFAENAFDRVYEGIDKARAELYQLCANDGVALTIMKPYAGGLLLDAAQTPFGTALTPTQCIAYCLDRPAVSSVLPSYANKEQIDAAITYLDAADSERDYSMVLANAPKSSFAGHCMYCGHCAPCSVKINIADVNKYLDLALAQGFIPETVREHYGLLEHHASECIECGICMTNCPFGTDIIVKMQQASELFGI